MQEWWRAQLENGFAAFSGARVSASVPLGEPLVNDWLARALARVQQPAAAPSPAADRPDLRRLAALVRRAQVELRDGVLTLHVDVEV
jgi:hypothetical protein